MKCEQIQYSNHDVIQPPVQTAASSPENIIDNKIFI